MWDPPKTPITPTPGLHYLLLHGTGGFGVTQAGPARERSQHRQHCQGGGTGVGGYAVGWGGHPANPCPPPHFLHCVLVSHRPPRYPTTSLRVRWLWKS